jgi:diguanylate cyclase (GGDEF)-like protein
MISLPSPGIITVSARLAASVGALAVCGLLLILWVYRRRDFILRWVAGWASAATALFVVSRADLAGALTPWQLGLGALASVASGFLFLSGIRRYGRDIPWRIDLVALGVAAAVIGVAALSYMASPVTVFGVVFLGMSAAALMCAWRAGAIGHQRRFVGAGVMAGAFGVISLANFGTAVAAAVVSIGTAPARVLLVFNAAAYLMVAFGQHLFVFEDMLYELQESNRELSATRAELRLAAITDALTGLYNRRFFDEVTTHHLEHHRRFHLSLSLLYIDVDRFKAINDTHGHAVGDQVLRHVAEYIRHKFREADYVFRIGGDEFVVLISCSVAEAEKRVRDLQGGFHATLIEADLPLSLGLSVGIAEVAAEASDLEQAIAQADERMYEDKRRRATSALGE